MTLPRHWATGPEVLERIHKLLLALPTECYLPDWAARPEPADIQLAPPPARFGKTHRAAPLPDQTLPPRLLPSRRCSTPIDVPPATHIARQIYRIEVLQPRLGAGEHKHGPPTRAHPAPNRSQVEAGTHGHKTYRQQGREAPTA